eukprot:scaffold91226_cov51-Phaeocystis_antarctica.AAC.1
MSVTRALRERYTRNMSRALEANARGRDLITSRLLGLPGAGDSRTYHRFSTNDTRSSFGNSSFAFLVAESAYRLGSSCVWSEPW